MHKSEGSSEARQSELIASRRFGRADVEIRRNVYPNAGRGRFATQKGVLELFLAGHSRSPRLFFDGAEGPVGGKLGALSYLPAGLAFESEWQCGEETILYCYFSGDSPECHRKWRDSELAKAVAIDSPIISDMMLRMKRELEEKSFFGDAVIEGLCLQVAAELGRHIAAESAPVKHKAGSLRHKLHNVILALEQRDDLPTLRELSDELGYNESYVSSAFQQITRRSFSSHIADLRIARAKLLLRDETLSVKEISYRLGFRTPAEFSRSFRRVARLSPTEFRAKFERAFCAPSGVSGAESNAY